MPGRKYSAGSPYRYGFNGKELDNGINSDDYDFGARIYDSKIGRWFSTDPLEADYAFASPYNFVLDNPLNYVDPNGMKVETKKGTDVTNKEHKNMLRRISLLKRKSESFRLMYQDLENSSETFTFKSVVDAAGDYGSYDDNTKTISIDVRQNGGQLSRTRKQFMRGSLQKIGHEVGHGWRSLHKLDGQAPVAKPPVHAIYRFGATKAEKIAEDKRVFELNTKNSREFAEAQAAHDQRLEIGGMEIENLVGSELRLYARFRKYSYMKTNYGSKLIVIVDQELTKALKNGIYYKTAEERSNREYDAFKNYPMMRFNGHENIHHLYEVQPVKKP